MLLFALFLVVVAAASVVVVGVVVAIHSFVLLETICQSFFWSGSLFKINWQTLVLNIVIIMANELNEIIELYE